MKIHTFGIATVAALLISQLSAPIPGVRTSTSSYLLDQATFTLVQTNSVLSFQIEDRDPLAVDLILVNGEELSSDELGYYSYDMKQQLEVEVVLSSDSPSSADNEERMRHIASKSFHVVNLDLGESAVAQSTSATRTRIRYQTFIAAPKVEAFPLVCTYPFGALSSYFYGNNRSWDPDSNAFKTRFDTIISWGTLPSVKKETFVGASVRHTSQAFEPKERDDTLWASDESMVLGQITAYSDYISYRIRQNVPNPFCSVAEGIQFDFMFYVKRNGSYTFFGDYLPVPYHEVYARDNLNADWRTLALRKGEDFNCFSPWKSAECTVNDITKQGTF